MKKVSLVLAVLALTSCKFDQNGNKNIIPIGEIRPTQQTVSTTAAPQVDETNTEATATAATEETEVSTEKVDAAGNYIYDVGEMLEIELPNGEKMKIGANSTENQLFSMLNNSDFVVSADKTQGWITLDRVYFTTGSDELTATSQNQLDNIVALLKAFPGTEVKLGGYTDNTGSQQINQPLSEGRAKSVMNKIGNAGVDVARLAAEGYGSEHPLCPANDSDVCKAKNRRVDIRITKK
ncbi:OmpA family protein [Weeksellaceae bacterium KMM 9713]|uniref:OmpA family protein n=1 Tax=Profundicola chukchiensis TaxID=2961959 RepID=A0A9X4MYZ2_9FLAO|nr:OmpA family protein [Profundicola chukchiensis]MDG4946594.1 OmpA family protein [Profundicola chukchiensis]